jgi:hypothetical protein
LSESLLFSLGLIVETYCGSLLLKLSGLGSHEFMLQPAKGQTPVQLKPLKQFITTKEQLIPENLRQCPCRFPPMKQWLVLTGEDLIDLISRLVGVIKRSQSNPQ